MAPPPDVAEIIAAECLDEAIAETVYAASCAENELARQLALVHRLQIQKENPGIEFTLDELVLAIEQHAAGQYDCIARRFTATLREHLRS